MRYKEFITELFDTNVPWKFRKDDIKKNFIFSTTIDNKEVELEYHSISGDFRKVSVSFTVDGEYMETGSGSAMRIFGAVINNMRLFVEKVKPEEVVFTALKLGGNSSDTAGDYVTRVNLYKRMVIKFAGNLGYDYNFENGNLMDRFVLTKKGIIQ